MADPEKAVSTDMESVEDDDERALAEKFVNQPGILAALQSRFQINNVMQNLPAPVKRRLKSLKQNQLALFNIEAKFFEEVHLLECKYNKISSELLEKRGNIISGVYEPTDEECVWESDEEDEVITNELKDKVKIEENKETTPENEEDKNIKGIPGFWLTIFKNVSLLSEMVQEHDEPILKHLYDIKVIFLEKDPMGFILEFHFEPNEYFSNSVLTKEYIMKCTPDKNDPFSFDGPEVFKSKGCTIDWKKGKNVTIKTIKKSQKHKSRALVRTITKTVQNDSFFNFFSPPVVPDDPDVEFDEDTNALLTSDFEIGHYIRERIVSRAVLYFTGEGLEDEGDDYDDEEDADEEEEDEDDLDEESDEDEEQNNKNKNKTGAPKGQSNPAECKQQ